MLDRFKQFINSLNLFRKAKGVYKINPYNNWILVVFVFIIINAFLISGKILEFYRIGSDEALLSESTLDIKPNTINRTALSEIISLFKIREASSNSLKRNRPSFIDPSI